MSLEAPTTDLDLEEILNLDPAELKQILAEVFQKKPEELIKLEEEVKKADPAMIAEMQKQKPLLPTPYQPKPPPRQRRARRMREILREFELAPRWWSRNQPGSLNELEDLYGDVAREGEETRGRRFLRWTIIKGLDKDLTPNFMEKIRRNVRTSFYMRHIYTNVLRNLEDGSTMNFYKNIGSPWMKTMSDAERWLGGQEERRLDSDNVERPNTKWVSDGFFNAEVKVVPDSNAPLVGTGRLPDWLRNLAHSRSMVTLDTYEDNLCLWRCIAVHQGSLPHRSTKEARSLAKRHFNLSQTPSDVPKTSLDELDKVERNVNKGKAFSNWLGIRVFEPQQEIDREVIWYLRRSPPEKLTNIMTIGVHRGHAFLIKDITKLAKTYECKDCHQRFTQANSLKRHTQTCSKGKTVIMCPGEKVEKPQTAYEKAFFPKHYASKASLLWLERKAKQLGKHIHHAMCGHGGERWINGAPVDGYHPETKTIYQYHGCPWHGCRSCFPQERERVIGKGDKTLEERFQATTERTAELRKAGYLVIEAWECEVGWIKGIDAPKEETKSYPHVCFYDFEAYGDDKKRKRVTPMLTIENEHVLISVSIGDSLEREPTHICKRDPAELVRRFVEELKRRGKAIRDQVRSEFVPEDVKLLPKKQREQINEWCNQVPVLGFNSGSYDLNVIKKYFVENIAKTANRITVAKKGNKIMFMHTQSFRFLDIINYLGPGMNYDKWVKAYGSEAEKSWFPYDWFDSPEKLDFPGLPDYPEWYSKLKGGYVLTLDEYARCQRRFTEKGMSTFADWLRDYNDQDVAPGLEALQKMRSFYTEKGIDMLKDAVSHPGVSMHYLLSGAVERGAELYAPSKEEYEMLKGAVVGGPSLVFTRYHEVGKTWIRGHKVKEPRLCKKILGYDANALYPSTMLRDMPCGKGRVVKYEEAPVLVKRQKEGKWFGFAEVDIEIPEGLRPKFAEMCPFF